MAQLQSSRDKRAFYRQTFEIKDNGKSVYRHTLLINPEDMNVEEPHRATVTQTMGGAYLSLFGQGLHNVSLSGKTGYHARRNAEGVMTDGYEEIQNLRKRIYRDFINMPSSQYEMFWYNWEDEEYYKIMPMSMRVQRNTSGGLMYRYDIQFTCLEALGAQTKPDPDNLLSNVRALQSSMALSQTASSISEVLEAFKRRMVN
jgi:hypothetical protein